MTAQYKPYRDEESVDGLETASWTVSHEPGSVQIYERTTEELPFNSASRKSLWLHSAFYLSAIILGFLLGFFSHTHSHDDAKDSSQLSLQSSLYHEDPTIKDKLLNQIDGHNILRTLEKFKDIPRTPGSAGDHELANHVENEFIAFGLGPVTNLNYTFKTMLPTKAPVIKLLNKSNETIYSTESDRTDKDFISFLPLSQSEKVSLETDQIIYLNKGTKEDYAKLSTLGLNATMIEGKVFVIRQSFYQAHDAIVNAQENGAKALLLFPDPDTYGSNSPFPSSVQLPADAAKSHPLAWSNYGDLVSFNYSSLAGVDISKLGIDKESKVLIPVILLSFETAGKILLGLSGSDAPKEWNCFDFTLHIGPSYKEGNDFGGRDKISIEFYNEVTKVNSATITGIIPGSLEADRYIVLGSRRDSLNQGVLDSLSGTAVMLEMARVIGGLVKQGWRPRRTIVFNSFGSESLNLIGSSNWLESHQRLLHSRAVAYINCDLVVTGNQTVNIAASPLLYQVLYNATRQVADPNNLRSSVYDSWSEHFRRHKSQEIKELRASVMPQYLAIVKEMQQQLDNEARAALEGQDPPNEPDSDALGQKGNILHEFQRSAITPNRPKARRLDLQSIYSPFFLYAGIPVVDVRYTGFRNAEVKTSLVDDTLPLLGTKYDNLAAVQHIDPHLRYHVAVGQVLSEILRDLSDSIYLPFNLLDYAVTLRDNYAHFVRHYGKKFTESKLELDSLKQVIDDFTRAAIKFHYRQDRANMNDAMQIRKFNDQMMLLERAFLDPSGLPSYAERKHILLGAHDGEDHKEGFPGLVDWITLLESEELSNEDSDYTIFIEVLKVHYKAVIYTIQNAIKIIDDVYIL